MSKFERIGRKRWVSFFYLTALLLMLTLGQRSAHAGEQRFALVIGNDEYKAAKLATPANDAGLVANALTAAGFTVTGARNLDQATLRESVREFLGQVAEAGPDAVAVIYLAGFGVQFAGENYYVPVDADLVRDVDVPLQAVRISDFAQPLAALPARVKVVILDAARQNAFAQGGEPLASGLALVDAPPGMAVAFNAAPGTVGPEEPGPYGAYATALTEMIAAGGLPLDDVFARVRLRVSEVTNGGEVPWYASQLNAPFLFTERSADAPPPADAMPVGDLRDKPMRSYGRAEDAYAAALALDTIDGYEQFLSLYPNSRYARRIAAMVAVRREEIVWRRCVFNNTPPAYWSYLRRYPNGPHVWDARRRLAMIGAMLEGPPDFAAVDFGVPPPPPDEMEFVDRPVVGFWGDNYGPPPPPPAFFLPPRPREFVVLPPPPPPRERFFLPAPVAAIVPAFVRPPPAVAVRPATTGPTPVALPPVVSRGGAPGPHGGPGAHPGAGGAPAVAIPNHPAGAPPTASPPSTAAIRPAPPPVVAPGTAPAPAMVRPGTPPPPPHPESPATIKPATPPPPHPEAVAPATVKPATPPPPHPEAVAPATVKPATPPPPPSGAGCSGDGQASDSAAAAPGGRCSGDGEACAATTTPASGSASSCGGQTSGPAATARAAAASGACSGNREAGAATAAASTTPACRTTAGTSGCETTAAAATTRGREARLSSGQDHGRRSRPSDLQIEVTPGSALPAGAAAKSAHDAKQRGLAASLFAS